MGAEVSPSDTLFEIETNDLVQATNDLLAALDNAAKARTTLDLAERNQARQLELFTARAASRREWEQALADATNAAADLRVAETGLSAARDKLRVLGRSLDQIQAIETSRTVEAVVAVRAPIGGTVVQRRVGPGQWLVTGQGDPVFTIADLSTMWLVAAVRELDAPLIRVGQEVSVTVAALPQHTFRARITTLGTGLDSTTRRLSVRAEIEDPDRLLRPEMSATFRIMVGAPTENIGLPISALIHRGAETHVWAALPDQRFELRRIKTGTRAGDMVEVTEGLQPGDRVVTGGALFVDRAARID
ncbi:MAG: efflux RND transporter periplasmic adaptor subunit [Acetobacteraceae bacterium]|nr:efflux RND transporter periplasmic adaptor subunit [Acetobacteraceae bacterium]